MTNLALGAVELSRTKIKRERLTAPRVGKTIVNEQFFFKAFVPSVVQAVKGCLYPGRRYVGYFADPDMAD